MDIIVPSNYGGGLVWAQYAVSDAFQERIAGERLGRAGYAYVVDRRGLPLAYPKGDVMRRVVRGEVGILSRLPQVREAAGSSDGAATVATSLGASVLTAWATVSSTGWKVFVEQPESAAFAPLRGKIGRRPC